MVPVSCKLGLLSSTLLLLACSDDSSSASGDASGGMSQEDSSGGTAALPTTGGDGSSSGAVESTATTDAADSTDGAESSGLTGSSSDGSPSVCGDGRVDDGEDCDDAGESQTCNSDCTAAECGDGIVNESAGENCDDQNDRQDDGCDACSWLLKSEVLLCGDSNRDMNVILPPDDSMTLLSGCLPNVDTQALLVPLDDVSGFSKNEAAIIAWVEAGGHVVTGFSNSEEVFSAIFSEKVGGKGSFGGCADVAPTVVQFSGGDPFWEDNVFEGIPLGVSGCGASDISDWPEVTHLAGWSDELVSIGYRDAVQGRVWLAEFDWADEDADAATFDYTASLLRHMITQPHP